MGHGEAAHQKTGRKIRTNRAISTKINVEVESFLSLIICKLILLSLSETDHQRPRMLPKGTPELPFSRINYAIILFPETNFLGKLDIT